MYICNICSIYVYVYIYIYIYIHIYIYIYIHIYIYPYKLLTSQYIIKQQIRNLLFYYCMFFVVFLLFLLYLLQALAYRSAKGQILSLISLFHH